MHWLPSALCRGRYNSNIMASAFIYLWDWAAVCRLHHTSTCEWVIPGPIPACESALWVYFPSEDLSRWRRSGSARSNKHWCSRSWWQPHLLKETKQLTLCLISASCDPHHVTRSDSAASCDPHWLTRVMWSETRAHHSFTSPLHHFPSLFQSLSPWTSAVTNRFNELISDVNSLTQLWFSINTNDDKSE